MSRSYSADAAADEWHWEFLGSPVSDPVPLRGRLYYKAIIARRPTDGLERIYNVGDPVVLNSGDGAALWVAQLLNIFEEQPPEHAARRDRFHFAEDDPEPFRYMRCTLRWFESPADIAPEARRLSKVPKPFADEIYVSDHVEEEGFNCVTDIRGMAFLLASAEDREAFEEEPDPRYVSDLDRVCIVRGFANSSVDNVVRGLDDGELECILKHPCSDRHLHDNSLQRFFEVETFHKSDFRE